MFWLGHARMERETEEPTGQASPNQCLLSLPQSPLLLHLTVLLPPPAFSPPLAPPPPLPAAAPPAGGRRNHTATEGQQPRLEVEIVMEDLLHCFVSSGFADRPDASPCRTTTSSTRDGEVGGHESAQARGGRRSWRLGFSHQVNGLRVGQIWSAGLARTPCAYSLASSLRPSTSPHFAGNPPQVPFILWSSPLIMNPWASQWSLSFGLNIITGLKNLLSENGNVNARTRFSATYPGVHAGYFFINARFERLLRNGNRSTRDGTLTCPIPGLPLYRLQPPRKAAEVFLTNFPRGVIYGCGDLIFWTHVIFTPVFHDLPEMGHFRDISCFLSWEKTKKYCSLQPLYVLWLLTIVLSNFPQQKVQLKIGVPVMLLRNINQSIGLCNGTPDCNKVRKMGTRGSSSYWQQYWRHSVYFRNCINCLQFKMIVYSAVLALGSILYVYIMQCLLTEVKARLLARLIFIYERQSFLMDS